jgi:hypothetical protein
MSEQPRSAEIEEGLVESVLEDASLPCRRCELGWVIPVGGRRSCEVALVPTPGGLRVEAVLASWDDLGALERQALEHFLGRATMDLRLARCELRDRQAVVAVDLAAGDVEVNLPHAVGAVLTAGRLLAREVGALLRAEVAERYLRFFALGSEMAGATGRI